MKSNRIARRHFCQSLSVTAALQAFPIPSNAQSGRKPNILLVMTDDQGWGDIHSHGNELIETPVLDQLARDGARFEQFYVSPVCAPTRASLLTGRYHLRTGVHGVTRGYETMRADEVTIAELFKSHGYATGCFGKWHNGAHYPHDPNGQGFDEFWGFCAGHWNNYFNTTLQHNNKMVKTNGYISDVLTDKAIEFIEENKGKPFLCYVPYNAPHSPWQVPDKYFNKYKATGLDDKTACAYAMCENIDDNIGRMLSTLNTHDLSEDTIVLFLTDNGPNSDRYNGNMNGRKGSAHEGGIRVPLFVRYPKTIDAGLVIEPITSHIDLLPTLASICGISVPGELKIDGKNLYPLITKDDVDWPDRMIFTNWNNRGSVRTDRWRAVTNGNQWQLFDILNDPNESNDVSKQFPGVLARLKKAYGEWYEECTEKGFDPIPTQIGHPESKTVVLPGHEAFLVPKRGEGIGYKVRSGWANDWVTDWTETGSYPYWNIKVVDEGEYDISLQYCCPQKDLGAEIVVQAADSKLKGKITEAHDPDYIPSPDRVPRKEVYEKVWADLLLGKMHLPKGEHKLTVKALSKPGSQVMELKSVTVIKR